MTVESMVGIAMSIILEEFPFGKRYVIEFYYAHQNNRGPEAVDINAFGWVFQLYFGK
jgi:hypothetical protein